MTKVELAKYFLSLLEGHRLTVVLVPADQPRHSGHMVRSVQEANTKWYRDFCGAYESCRKRKRRKFETKIKRSHTISALRVIIKANGSVPTSYTERVSNFLDRVLADPKLQYEYEIISEEQYEYISNGRASTRKV